jgi:hypothetical protein
MAKRSRVTKIVARRAPKRVCVELVMDDFAGEFKAMAADRAILFSMIGSLRREVTVLSNLIRSEGAIAGMAPVSETDLNRCIRAAEGKLDG